MPDVLVLTNIGHSFCLCHHKTQPMPAGYQEKNGIHVILWHYISKSAPQNSAFLAQNQRFRRWITGVAVEDGSNKMPATKVAWLQDWRKSLFCMYLCDFWA